MSFEDKVSVGDLDQQHPHVAQFAAAWDRYDLLAAGGERLKQQAHDFVQQKPKEPEGVYEVRRARFTYENHFGTGLGWYIASLFGRDPRVIFGKTTGKTEERLGRIRKNADQAGTSFEDFFREVYRDAMIYKTSWVLIDRLPPNEALSLADQQAESFDPYLVRYPASQVIQWFEDDRGNLTSVTLKKVNRLGTPTTGTHEIEEWWIYNETEFAVFRRDFTKTADGKIELRDTATKINEGFHALSAEGKVPFVRAELSNELWLADRAALAVQDHLDCDNTLSWKLFMANLAMLGIFSAEKFQPTAAEWSYLNLAPGDRAEWIEPSGTSFEHSATRLDSKREEIFRMMHLTFQGRSSTASADAQSGESKKMEMAPARDIQEAYGDFLRMTMSRTAEMLLAAAGIKDITVEIGGFNFKAHDTDATVQHLREKRELGIQSDTLDLVLVKRIATEFAEDETSETQDTIHQELDSGKLYSIVQADKQKQLSEMSNELGALAQA